MKTSTILSTFIIGVAFITSAHAEYYCNFTCLLQNPHFATLRALEGGYQRAAVMVDDQALVSGSGETDYAAYKDAWQSCRDALPKGTKMLVVTESLIQQGNLIFGGRDARPNDCIKARD